MTGNELRTLRKKANMTQTEVGKALGVSHATVCSAEARLDQHVRGRIADALAARPEWHHTPGHTTDGVQTSLPVSLDDGPNFSRLLHALRVICVELRRMRELYELQLGIGGWEE